MALPKQVQREMDELAQLEASLTVKTEQPTTDASQNEAPAEVPADEAQVSNVVELKKPEPPVEDWQQKYQSLKGHFDAEVPRLHQQNKELASQLQEMQKQIAELNKPKPQPDTDDRLVTKQDEDSFGSDLVDLQRRVAREVMREHVAPLQGELSKRDARIEQLENMLTRTQGDVTSMTFEQQLERVVPDFSKINADPKWVAWLDAVDSNGDSIRPRAEAAYNAGDIGKVAKYVEAFKATLAPVRKNESNQQELRQQVAPPKTATPQSNVPQGERVYTEAEANRLWDKVTKLYTQGKNDEGLSLENELSAAYSQGRIRP